MYTRAQIKLASGDGKQSAESEYLLKNDNLCKKRQPNSFKENTLTIGQTELNQLCRFLNKQHFIEKHLPQLGLHNFLITFHSNWSTTVIQITDQRKISQHFGGASFRVIVRTDHRLFACPYIDYEDGTYDIICQTNVDIQHDITVTLTYIDYGAYRWDGVFFNQTLWNGQITNNITMSAIDQLHYVGWYRNNREEAWRWIRAGNREILSDDELRTCIKKQTTLVDMIGESHLGYVYEYLQFLFGKLTTDVVKEKFIKPTSFYGYKFSRMAYIVDDADIPGFYLDDKATLRGRRRPFHQNRWWPSLMFQLSKWKLSHLKRFSSKHKPLKNENRYDAFEDILVIQFGTWDISYRNVKYFIPSISEFESFLNSTRGHSALSKVKIIIWGPPPYKECNRTLTSSPSVKYILLNNAVLAAANQLMKETVQSFTNVIYIDQFATLFCRTDESVDPNHYMRSEITRKNKLIFLGTVGKIAAKLLLEATCTHPIENKI